jgi:L-ascorbate metabolism protein UlaG (beta-lactamase superfamily)
MISFHLKVTQPFKLWWLRTEGFLIKWQGKYLLFDPYLSDSLTLKYQHTEKPHVRMSELAIDPASTQLSLIL